MPQWFTKKIEEKEQALYVTPKPPQTESVRLTGNATKDLSNIRAALHDTADFMVREITLDEPSAQALRDWVLHRAVLGMDQNEVETLGELFPFLMSGFAGIMIDGIEKVFVTGVQ